MQDGEALAVMLRFVDDNMHCCIRAIKIRWFKASFKA